MTTKKKVTKKKTARKVIKKKATPKAKRKPSTFVQPENTGTIKKVAETWPWPLRPYQQEAHDAHLAGLLYQIMIWHRRAGKDVFCLSKARNEALKRIGGYVHFFPKHVQAKRAIWNGVDPKMGRRFIDIAFADIETNRNNSEMFLELINGSTWQLLGSDNFDRVVGSNIVGASFSEWALCDPRAWDYIRPMIRENKGWVNFITTYRSRNHAWQMVQKLKDNPEWFVSIKPITDTTDIAGNPILTEADMQAERDGGMTEALLQQEYYCNPEAVAEGAIYGRQVEALRRDTTRHQASWNPNKPVCCVWNIDLPVHASCVVVQPGITPLILDAQSYPFATLAEAISKIEQRPYPIMQHILPAEQRSLAVQFHDLMRHPDILHSNPMINAVAHTTNLLDRCSIDMAKCELLLDALSGYVRRERFDAQVADMQFSDSAVQSWHEQLTAALETWAAWEYNTGEHQWRTNIDYSQQDRIAKTLL